MYHNDIGIVYGHIPSSDVEVVVAFIPQLKEKTTGSAKCKRVSQPEPRRWLACQVKARWGKSQVQRISNDEYKFGGDIFKSGIVMKHLSPASLEATNAPFDISEFARASCIVNAPFFSLMTRQTIQELIKVGQRIRVVSEEQQGWIGHPISITDSIALLTRSTDNVRYPSNVLCRPIDLAIMSSFGEQTHTASCQLLTMSSGPCHSLKRTHTGR